MIDATLSYMLQRASLGFVGSVASDRGLQQ